MEYQGICHSLATFSDNKLCWPQVSLIEPGTFRTSVLESAVRFPVPEVYTAPNSGAAKIQEVFGHLGLPETKLGDPRKAAERIYELSSLPNPPLRLPLGLDAIQFIRRQLESISSDLEDYKSWSEGVREK